MDIGVNVLKYVAFVGKHGRRDTAAAYLLTSQDSVFFSSLQLRFPFMSGWDNRPDSLDDLNFPPERS